MSSVKDTRIIVAMLIFCVLAAHVATTMNSRASAAKVDLLAQKAAIEELCETNRLSSDYCQRAAALIAHAEGEQR
jgi:hypothetical protein